MSEKQTAGQAADVMDGMQSFATALANRDPNQAAYGRERLPEPATDTFGIHEWKRPLVIGRANILNEVDKPNIELLFSVFEPDGTKKVIGIGRTPQQLDPARGGQLMLGAGRDHNMIADEYLMLVHKGDPKTPPRPFYLSREQLDGITVAPGDEGIPLNPYLLDATHAQGLEITGRVEAVQLLE